MNPSINTQYETIKAAINITEVIGQFVKLKKTGSSYMGLCPFHNEQKPSFSVTPAKGLYHCFGCYASGDAITFLQQHLQYNFRDAMQWLASHYHLPLDDAHGPYNHHERTPVHTPTPPVADAQDEPTCSFIPREHMEGSLRNFEGNNLIRFLHTLFHEGLVARIIYTYRLGISYYYPGGTILWQIDEQDHVRAGKIMPFDPVTGRRNREAKPPSHWVHSILKLPGFKLQQCFYGQHLLAEYPTRPVAIVESEKTAMIASIYFPSFTWLASGGKSNLSREKCKCLVGRKVILFPDLGAYDEWKKFARDMRSLMDIEVCDLLQKASAAYNLPDKSDLCDYLTGPAFRHDLRQRFKQAFTLNPDPTEEEQWAVWRQFRDMGLRPEDRVIALKELIRDGVMDGPEGWVEDCQNQDL